MLTTVLYIRVSTDEQAQKGYSQRSQEEKLSKYCKDNHIEIVQTIFEDHSAKSFDRPAWTSLMKQLTANKAAGPQLILFSRWDRFSRNTANAYYMISQLQKMGIEPQATDQPLDMSIPENKILLAMYIATAEVENDRRALNTKHGMHKAKKEGRYMGRAPIGYINISMPDGRKTIVPREPEAILVRRVFETFEEGHSIRSLHRASLKNGLKCSLNAFFNMLQNPIYCGKIKIQSEDKKTDWEVPGVHTPLISEELFNRVQSSIKHRDKKYVKQNTNSQLMFKGLLSCPICQKKLSGSGSKGRSRKYFYYHCYSPCSYRVRADRVNKYISSGIGGLKPDIAYIPIFKQLLRNMYEDLYQQKSIDKINIDKSFRKMMERVVNAKELLIKGTIEEEDYLSIKSDCENRIDILGKQLNDAYRLDVQHKKIIMKLTAYFSNPALIFQATSDSIQFKTAALFLKENLVYSEINIVGDIKCEAQIIYGLSYPNTKWFSNEIEKTNNLSKEQKELLAKIMKIEKDKGHKILPQDALKVLLFLSELAKICFPSEKSN